MKEIQKFTQACFMLPNGKYVLQRRTKDAPHSAGMLGFFGGWVDKDESPDDCIKREISEERSLEINKLKISLVKDYVIPGTKEFINERHFFLYKVPISDFTFKVYEGDGAESYTLEELKLRNDLISSTYYAIHNYL